MRLLAVLLMFVAGQAHALSCLPPDVARSYQWAAQSEDNYVVLLGHFSFNEKRFPKRDMSNPTPQSVTVPAQFTGRFLSKNGFVSTWSGPVSITAGCAGPWCSGPPSKDQVLAFVKKSEAGYELITGPCGGNVFENPSVQMLNDVQACHRGRSCKPDFP